jgi:predicted membrane-bound mannosyltransferase
MLFSYQTDIMFNMCFWMFWVVSIMIRYINDLYEDLRLIVKYDLNIVLMCSIACYCWDLNYANYDLAK